MKTADDPPTDRSPLGPAVAIAAVGWLAAWGSLSLAGYWQQQQWPAAAIPFGLNRVLVVHLLCVLPLAIWCGRWLTVVTGRSSQSIITCIAAGIVLAGASLFIAPAIPILLAVDASRGERHALRLIWSWLLLLPWGIAATAVYLRRARPLPRGERAGLLATVDGVIAALFAMLAVLHIQQVSGRHEALLSHAVANQQYLTALTIGRQLLELGSVQIGEHPAPQVVEELSRRVDASRMQLETPLPGDATLQQRLERVTHLHSLERFAEIEQVLAGVDDEPSVALRLALASEAQHDYRQAAERYGRTIERLGKLPSLEGEPLRLLRIAFERRANNLRRIGQTRQAETELLAALERWPQAQDALFMQLGFHYQLAGRVGEAIEYFQQAADLNPRLRAQADATLEQLELQAEGCLLRPTRGVTR